MTLSLAQTKAICRFVITKPFHTPQHSTQCVESDTVECVTPVGTDERGI